MMRSRKNRDSHFRPAFKINPKTKVRGFVGDARKLSRGRDRLTISEMLYRTGLKTTKALARACRAGRLPMWKREPSSGRVVWPRLEVEAFMYWRRAKKARSRTGQALK
jgi:hypothetical protein